MSTVSLGVTGRYLINAFSHFIPVQRGMKRVYKKGAIGTESRIPRNHERRIAQAQLKRHIRCEKRGEYWTGLRS